MKLSIFLEDEIDPVNLSYIDFIFAVMAQLVKYAEFLYIKRNYSAPHLEYIDFWAKRRK